MYRYDIWRRCETEKKPLLDFIILGFLFKNNMTGYEIKQNMARSTAYFYEASFGSIYPILKKLQEKSWAFLNECVEKGKRKKVYGITDLGKEAFMEWLRQPPSTNKEELMIRLHFYSLLDCKTVKSLIRHHITEIERIQLTLDKLDDDLKDVSMMEKVTLQYGRDFYRFHVDWLEKYVESLA